MRGVELVFAVGWAAFWLYWLVAAFSMKRGRHSWGREGLIRVIVIAVAFVAARSGAFHGHLTQPTGPLRSTVGLALFGAGLLFAVWARIHIGRNWGTPMTQKQDPELVTSGPYRLVRHPIYSGILLAGVGTSVALGWRILVIFGLSAIYFIYAATQEEKFMSKQFPDAYPAYKRSSKMLVPFVF
jgi:protein-S-isoprenylcysteine O-methyltransferase Ste14